MPTNESVVRRQDVVSHHLPCDYAVGGHYLGCDALKEHQTLCALRSGLA